jgi:hypothetical protein
MKKILAILMTICILASALCVTAFAATAPAAGIVLSITAERRGEEPTVIGDYDNFHDGWNDAMEIAGDSGEMRENNYTRIVVDLFIFNHKNLDLTLKGKKTKDYKANQ